MEEAATDHSACEDEHLSHLCTSNDVTAEDTSTTVVIEEQVTLLQESSLLEQESEILTVAAAKDEFEEELVTLASPQGDMEDDDGPHQVTFSDDIGRVDLGVLSPIPHSDTENTHASSIESSYSSVYSPSPVVVPPFVASPGASVTADASVDTHNHDDADDDNRQASVQSPLVILHETIEEEEEEVNDKVNDSMTSTGSLGEEELIRAKEEVGASSLAFIQRLRGAAFRRKMNLTRSRDSLAAKEREQRQVIAASKLLQEQRRVSEPPPSLILKTKPAPDADSAGFKALPLPACTGLKGHGGLSGVPKVGKKPTTTPFSPLLGARRQIRRFLGQEGKDVPARRASINEKDDDSHAFRARELPPTTGQLGHAGQVGIPKVAKRPVTVPMSPMLGARRKQPNPPEKYTTQRQSEGSMSAAPSSVLSASAGSALFGLDLSKENMAPSSTSMTTPRNSEIRSGTAGYQPHSTTRAKKRADFDAQRSVNEQVRLQKEASERQRQVQALRKELKGLRTSL